MSLLQSWDNTAEVSLREVVQQRQSLKAPTALADVVGAIFRNKRPILIALLVFYGLVTAFLIFSPKTYESKLLYLVRNEGSDFSITSFDERGAIPQMASEVGTELQLGTEVELLSGTELHRQVLSTLEPQASAEKIEKQLPGFDKHVKVLPVPKTTLIGVTFVGSSRANALATLDALNKQYLASRMALHGSDKAFAFFELEANRYYLQLQAAQQDLADFEKTNQVSSLDEEKDLLTRRLSELHAMLNDVDASQAESQRKLDNMASASSALPERIQTQKRELPDQVGAERLNSLLVDLQNKRLELLTKYHASDRHVQEVDEQIANTRDGLKRAESSKALEEQSDVNPLRASVDSELVHMKFQAAGLQAKQKSLKAQAAQYDIQLAQLNGITARHDDLVRSIRQNEENYGLYSKRREEARIDKTLDQSKIANVALVSGPAITPQPLIQTIISAASIFILGSLLIIGAGVVAGLWSPTFHAPWEIETLAVTPVLATIPSIKFGNKRWEGVEGLQAKERPTREIPRSMTSIIGARVSQDANRQRGTLIAGAGLTLARNAAISGGAYYTLVEKLRKISPSRPGGLVFAFTSSIAGEGVSHVVAGLSEELQAYTGNAVKIVSWPEEFFTNNQAAVGGTSDLSTYNESGEDILRTWFRRLREENDYVLLDCPALGDSHTAVALGRESDGVLLVVGAGESTRIQLRGSLASLSLASVPLVGIALNKRRYPVPKFIYKVL